MIICTIKISTSLYLSPWASPYEIYIIYVHAISVYPS